jgi:hypothetical protein
MTTTHPPQKMVRMQSGKMVPAHAVGQAKVKPKKFLVVIQHYPGDITAAEELASLIADLERTRNHDADILLFRRADSREIATLVQQKLAAKFDNVLTLKSRRTDARGHPWGCNAMFYDLIALMTDMPVLRDSYYAFVNLETDAVPTRPGWIRELIDEWKQAVSRGKYAVGEIRTDPRPHLNGLAVYSADFGHRVKPARLSGGSPRIAYDIAQSEVILPHAEDTPLIYVNWRQSTASPDEIFAERRDYVAPAIYHGVKDGSARAAVKERHVSSGIVQKRPSVFTYIPRNNLWGNDDRQTCLDLWRQGWMSRGWNPVILTMRDAAKHTKYQAFIGALSRLPSSIDRDTRDNQLLRWLALDSAGGGLMVEWDVLPESLTPESTLAPKTSLLGGAYIPKPEISAFIDKIIAYDAQPEDVIGATLHVNDTTVMARDGFTLSMDGLHQFNASTIGVRRQSEEMAKFLRG